MIQGYPHQAARRLIASYPTYAQAQRAVDMLSDQSFPVEHVSIVADGLSIVEQVTGRLGWGKSMVNGAIAGAATGALIGFIWGLFSWIEPLVSGIVLALYGLLIGGAIGALIGLVLYAVAGGHRDFTSDVHVQAASYSLLVDADEADRAVEILETNP